MSVEPSQFSRRSPVYRRLAQSGARFAALNGAAVAMSFGSVEEERVQRDLLGLADLSLLPRIGFKGPGAADWLGTQGVLLPSGPNRSVSQSGGERVAALSATEFLTLSDLSCAGGLVRALSEAALSPSAHCYRLERFDTHYWFALTGARAADCLAKLCGVDFRPSVFQAERVAQTLVAGSAAIVLRSDRQETLLYSILGDSAAAEFIWDALHDAMMEYHGRAIGLLAIRD